MNMAVTPIRFQVSKPVLAGREQEYVQEALETGWISSSGKFIELFEDSVSSFLQIEGGIAVSSGTAALHLACLGMELKPGMDVIVPSLTYVASSNAVTYCGANSVFADCDPYTWNVSPLTIEKAWTSKTVGVLLVHLYGLPSPIDEIAVLCQERGAWIVEDCAESFGSQINGRNAGSFGDAAAFSFFGNKIISTGEGGMVFIQDPERRQLVKMRRGQGMDLNSKLYYWHSMVGYNYRMTNVAAAIGLGQIERAEYHLSERRRIAKRYLKNLRPLEDRGYIRLPVEPKGYHNVYWLFCIVLESGGAKLREQIRNILLHSYGVETRPFFVPIHHLPISSGDYYLPQSEFLGEHGINLPTYSGLSDDDIDEISDIVTNVIIQEKTK
jgi:perosamine synthetase